MNEALRCVAAKSSSLKKVEDEQWQPSIITYKDWFGSTKDETGYPYDS